MSITRVGRGALAYALHAVCDVVQHRSWSTAHEWLSSDAVLLGKSSLIGRMDGVPSSQVVSAAQVKILGKTHALLCVLVACTGHTWFEEKGQTRVNFQRIVNSVLLFEFGLRFGLPCGAIQE